MSTTVAGKRQREPSNGKEIEDVCIVSAVRTAIGNFQGSLASHTAVDLGAIVIKEALKRANVSPQAVDEVIMGHVLSANAGQAPARQAALKAGLPTSVIASTVNKVCASGMKAVMFAAQSIMLGQQSIVVAGGMESMSNTPYYLPNLRTGARYGNCSAVDGIQRDGLSDAGCGHLMGVFGEVCADKYNISRQAQDSYAAESYRRALDATRNGRFEDEIVPVEVASRKGEKSLVVEDEEVTVREVTRESLGKLKTAFKTNGTVTAGNASPLSDGAAALVLVSRSKAEELGLSIVAVIKGFADAAQEPSMFTTSPSLAIPKALSNAGCSLQEVDFFEINEAFSGVAIANTQILNISTDKVNVHGGAVAIGHPLGCSGARILVTLCSILKQRDGKIGVAGVCNGGGGASAIVIERPDMSNL